MACVEIKELLGKKADDEQELMELIEEVPTDSIYYHTHSCFLRHPYISGQYPNDFADWAAIQVRDRVLGEKLAVITPSGDKTIEHIRTELIEIIDSHLSSIKMVPAVMYGHPFYFMQSKIIEIPTGVVVDSLKEFTYALETIDASSIYNHVFEARMRDRLGRSDFSIWFDEVLGKKDLAERFESVDSYLYSLEGLRSKLLQFCQHELKK